MMGVKYYLTTSETARAQAGDVEELTEVASSGPWTVFEVADAELVAPLANQPAVLTDVGRRPGRVARARRRLVPRRDGP